MAARWDLEMFTSEIENYPFLFDKSTKNYRNLDMKKTVWEMIGKKFGMSGELNKFIVFHNCRVPLYCVSASTFNEIFYRS